jgi:Protein of unknown function (DUF3489)
MDTKTIETSTTTTAAEVPASEAPKTPKAPKATKKAAAEKETPKPKKTAKKAKAKKVAAKVVAKVAKASTKAIAKASTKKAADGPRPESKKAEVIAMIQAKGGATLEAIMKRTGWQKHTVRGFMATVPAKLGLKLKSEKVEGARTYSA